MIGVGINYWAVLVMAIIQMVVGMLWWSPALFGKTWLKVMNWTKGEQEKAKKGFVPAMIGSFIASLVMFFVLAHVLPVFGSTLSAGFFAGFLVWLGFIVTTHLNSVLYEKRPTVLYLINIGYYLVNFLIAGAIFVLWV